MHSPANESRQTAWTPLVAYFLLAFAITWLSIIAFWRAGPSNSTRSA